VSNRAGGIRSRVVFLGLALGVVVAPVLGAPAPRAGAQTDSGTLVGEGGSAFQPVIESLLGADTTSLTPLNPAYTNVKLDNSIADFVGSAPGQFDADYAVTERQLTATESNLAKTNGRSFAYVPIAATPVAIATLVPNSSYLGGDTITSSNFCQGMPLTLTDLGDLYGLATPPVLNWGQSPLTCTSGGDMADPVAPALWANLDPTVENQALMALLDSTPTSKALFDAGLKNAVNTNQGLTTDDTPSEHWPYAKNAVPGGDQPLIGKLLNINATTNAPDTNAHNWQLGAALPISSVWTGAPLGVAWDLPTAAIQNAQGSFVAPSSASASAAEGDATLASTSDPTTNNLVTFTASPTDAKAYNNYLMMPEYLVVPTNTLTAVKATKLSQLIRFVLGPTGQKDISGFGAAPATAAMVTAGLKVAAQLSALGLSTAAASSTTTTTPGASSSTKTTAATTAANTSASTSTGDVAAAATGNSGSGSQGGAVLANTGLDPFPLVGAGAILVVVAGLSRRRLLRRTVAAMRPVPTSGRRARTRNEGR